MKSKIKIYSLLIDNLRKSYKNNYILIFIFALILAFNELSAQNNYKNKVIGYTLADRDRIIKIEEQIKSIQEQIKSIQKEMNIRFDAQNTRLEAQQQQINDLKNLFFWGFGILITFMIFILGFIIWDRKTVTDPIREDTRSLIQTLREFAKDHPKLADILRTYGLL